MVLRRVPTLALAGVVFPLAAVVLFWFLAVPLFDRLDWLPGALPIAITLSLAPTLTAVAVYRRQARPTLAVAFVGLALAMTVVWLWGFWILVIEVLDPPQNGYDWN